MTAEMPTTPEAAQAELDATLKTGYGEGPYFDANHPGHTLAVERMGKLRELAESAPPTPAPAEAPPDPLIPLPSLPEGQTWKADDVTAVNHYVQSVTALGMAPEEAGRWFHWALEQVRERPPDPQETLATLREEWGEKFEEQFQAARLATEKMGEGFKAFLNRTEVGNDIRVIKRMAALGASLLPLAKRKRAIETDPDFLTKFKSPERNTALVKEWQDLFKQLHRDD